MREERGASSVANDRPREKTPQNTRQGFFYSLATNGGACARRLVGPAMCMCGMNCPKRERKETGRSAHLPPGAAGPAAALTRVLLHAPLRHPSRSGTVARVCQ
jgi:hypothetical protein